MQKVNSGLNPNAKDGDCMGVETAFRAVFQPINPKYFAGIGQRYVGLSNKPDGVQWSAWHNHVDGHCELAVNLEGMEHDDWPIGRFIQRELADPKLPALATSIPFLNDVRIRWVRDAWALYKVSIKEHTILEVMAQGLTGEMWRRALLEARECLLDGVKGRATQSVTLPKKGLSKLEVSPHFQALSPTWPTMPHGHEERISRLKAARDRLQPLYDLVSREAT